MHPSFLTMKTFYDLVATSFLEFCLSLLPSPPCSHSRHRSFFQLLTSFDPVCCCPNAVLLLLDVPLQGTSSLRSSLSIVSEVTPQSLPSIMLPVSFFLPSFLSFLFFLSLSFLPSLPSFLSSFLPSFLSFFFVGLGFEFRVHCLQSRCSTT
jgi:hypothetical protein